MMSLTSSEDETETKWEIEVFYSRDPSFFHGDIYLLIYHFPNNFIEL